MAEGVNYGNFDPKFYEIVYKDWRTIVRRMDITVPKKFKLFGWDIQLSKKESIDIIDFYKVRGVFGFLPKYPWNKLSLDHKDFYPVEEHFKEPKGYVFPLYPVAAMPKGTVLITNIT